MHTQAEEEYLPLLHPHEVKRRGLHFGLDPPVEASVSEEAWRHQSHLRLRESPAVDIVAPVVPACLGTDRGEEQKSSRTCPYSGAGYSLPVPVPVPVLVPKRTQHTFSVISRNAT